MYKWNSMPQESPMRCVKRARPGIFSKRMYGSLMLFGHESCMEYSK
ncbi:hypothetical protein HMPREF9162_1977 [Selenomonas sp. oral taxon 137 str. F0430]|nr:hypothetical protein HMPREF9162_1977 [Selenomonas sp. oral taxon 137 str. F0430]EJP32370.1 hypothetical protein HMPREF1147_1013 [Selenomonas sp. FOBRC9]